MGRVGWSARAFGADVWLQVVEVTTEMSVRTIPSVFKPCLVRLDIVVGLPTVLTHSASRCELMSVMKAASSSNTLPLTRPARAMACGRASMPTPILVFARFAMHEGIDAPRVGSNDSWSLTR